jgi:hypothetical protein
VRVTVGVEVGVRVFVGAFVAVGVAVHGTTAVQTPVDTSAPGTDGEATSGTRPASASSRTWPAWSVATCWGASCCTVSAAPTVPAAAIIWTARMMDATAGIRSWRSPGTGPPQRVLPGQAG